MTKYIIIRVKITLNKDEKNKYLVTTVSKTHKLPFFFSPDSQEQPWIFHNDEWIGEHGAQTVTLSR